MYHPHNKLNIIIFCLLYLIILHTTKASKIEDSLVLVKSGNSCGTGVLCKIGDAIYIITNVHVLEYPDKHTFILMSGKELKTIEMEVADKLDLARLRVDDTDVRDSRYPRGAGAGV